MLGVVGVAGLAVVVVLQSTVVVVCPGSVVLVEVDVLVVEVVLVHSIFGVPCVPEVQ